MSGDSPRRLDFRVAGALAGQRLDKALCGLLPGLSRAAVQRAITAGACRIDGLRLRGLGRALLRIALASGVMVLAVLAWRLAVGPALDAPWRLVAEVLVGVVVYGVGLWGFARGLVGDALAGIGMPRLRIPGLRTRQGESTP